MERRLPGPGRKDPYRDQSKPAGNPQCASCKAVSIVGRWVPEKAAYTKFGRRFKPTGELTCPACRKQRDQYALGVVEIQWSGMPDAEQKLEDLLTTVRGSEAVGRERNDQDRILWTKTFRGSTRIYTSMPELARHIGKTLEKTYNGKSEYKKSTEEPFMHVIWRPEEVVNPTPRKKRREHRSKAFRGRGNEVLVRKRR